MQLQGRERAGAMLICKTRAVNQSTRVKKVKYETCESNGTQFRATRQSALQTQTDLGQTCILKKTLSGSTPCREHNGRRAGDHKHQMMDLRKLTSKLVAR